MKTTRISLEDYLKTIVEKQPESIATIIAQDIIDATNSKSFINDLLEYGCSSGAVPSMVLYHQTHSFFDKYYYEIEEIRNEYEIVIPHETDLKNFLAWASYETVAYQMYQDWENGS